VAAGGTALLNDVILGNDIWPPERGSTRYDLIVGKGLWSGPGFSQLAGDGVIIFTDPGSDFSQVVHQLPPRKGQVESFQRNTTLWFGAALAQISNTSSMFSNLNDTANITADSPPAGM
jgi:hypothetical protein